MKGWMALRRVQLHQTFRPIPTYCSLPFAAFLLTLLATFLVSNFSCLPSEVPVQHPWLVPHHAFSGSRRMHLSHRGQDNLLKITV